MMIYFWNISLVSTKGDQRQMKNIWKMRQKGKIKDESQEEYESGIITILEGIEEIETNPKKWQRIQKIKFFFKE